MQKCIGGILLLFIQGPMARVSGEAYTERTLKDMCNLDLWFKEALCTWQ